MPKLTTMTDATLDVWKPQWHNPLWHVSVWRTNHCINNDVNKHYFVQEWLSLKSWRSCQTRRLAKRILEQSSYTEEGDNVLPNDHILLHYTATITKCNCAIRLTKAGWGCGTLLTSCLRADGDERNQRKSSLRKNNKNFTTFYIKTQSCNPANKGHMRLRDTVDKSFAC